MSVFDLCEPDSYPRRPSRNALRLPGMTPLREVVETIMYDDAVRVERLSCGHTKTTLTPGERPAKRRRCLKCDENGAEHSAGCGCFMCINEQSEGG